MMRYSELSPVPVCVWPWRRGLLDLRLKFVFSNDNFKKYMLTYLILNHCKQKGKYKVNLNLPLSLVSKYFSFYSFVFLLALRWNSAKSTLCNPSGSRFLNSSRGDKVCECSRVRISDPDTHSASGLTPLQLGKSLRKVIKITPPLLPEK